MTIEDYLHDTRRLADEVRRRQDAALVEAIRVRLAPPFKPAVRVMVTLERPGVLTLVIGEGPGFVRADVDPYALACHTPEAVAEAILKAGRRALERAGIEVEDHIELGQE